MASLPSYVGLLYDSIRPSFDPSVARSEMERGVPKERVLNSRVLAEIAVTLDFANPVDAMSFEDWYFNDIRRVGWFDFRHPLSGQLLRGHFKAGAIGELRPVEGADRPWQRDVTMEYLR